ncbi:MAG: hypothetical protein ACO3J2_07620 [Chthoniobacterales bacterium]|jgi:hypothetical protein
MRELLFCQCPLFRRIGLRLGVISVLVAQTYGQDTGPTFTAGKDIVLSATTPLGEASLTIPAGTTITNNYEVLGEQVRIWQGPFVATVALVDVKPVATPTPAPTPEPTPTPTPPPSPTPTPETRAGIPMVLAELPAWAQPAAVGALAAYALLVTIALWRLRRRPAQRPAVTPEPVRTAGRAPVVELPTKAKPAAAVLADSGRAIACPLCRGTIPLEKVAKGRNICPSCQGAFVGE